MKNKTIKIIIAIILLAAIIAATVIPIVTQWGGAFYEPAGNEAVEVVLLTQNILKMDKIGIDEQYRDIMIEKLKE